MAGAKEIQNRINGIQDTMKITRAMYMMSTMKLRKARQKLEDTEPYFYGLQEQISSILYHFPDMEHLYFDNREKDRHEVSKRKAFIVITADKGMAGAYNHNVLKATEQLCESSKDYQLFVVGELGRTYLLNRRYPVDTSFNFTATNPSIHRARVITEIIVDMFKQEKIDEVDIIYTRMVNGMKEDVEVERLLPLKTHSFIKQEILEEARKRKGSNISDLVNYDADDRDNNFINEEDFLIYPSPKKVLKKLVYNYVTGFIYGALVEATASEENARMMAMQSATDNAQVMLHELAIEYNRVRQAAITQEITEVIGGAKALKKKKEKQKSSRRGEKISYGK